MSKQSIPTGLEKLIPKSLDDVIRSNRDQYRLALATEQEMHNLEKTILDGPLRHTLTNWQVIVLHVTRKDGAPQASPRLVGRVEGTGESWFTSHVVGIDTDKGLIQTANSIYRVIGSGGMEKDIDLLNVCVALHQWRLGHYLGVPEIFY